MEYSISFLEGIITFISPCLLPMLPIYVSFFANGESDKKKSLYNAFGFVLGFSLIFIALGAFAGSIGYWLKRYQIVLNIVTGCIVVLFGLNFTGLLQINAMNQTKKIHLEVKEIHFFNALIFGMIFSIGWTPCVGTFLGSALMLASQKGSWLHGVLMLLCYSIGLGIPFIVSAILIDRLKSTFDFIKRHYPVINLVSGIFLIITGLLMMSGMLGYLLTILSI